MIPFDLPLSGGFAHLAHDMYDAFGFAPFVKTGVSPIVGCPLGSMVRKDLLRSTIYGDDHLQEFQNIVRGGTDTCIC